MPNVAAALKAEIARVARKQLRSELEPVIKALQAQRTSLRQQRAQVDALARQVVALRRASTGAAAGEAESEGPARRFSASRFRQMRTRLGLSASQCGAFLGVSAQSIYAWERGAARPGPEKLEAISMLRGIGKRALAAKLAEIR